MNRRGWGLLALLVVFLSFAGIGRLAAVNCDDKCRQIQWYFDLTGGNKQCQYLEVPDCFPCTSQAGFQNCDDTVLPGAGSCTAATPMGQGIRNADSCGDLCPQAAKQNYSQASAGSANGLGLTVTLLKCKN
jgi:hypothetical protein